MVSFSKHFIYGFYTMQVWLLESQAFSAAKFLYLFCTTINSIRNDIFVFLEEKL